MDKIASLFTTIGEFLNNTRWYHLVQWPFCTLLVILAFCGVYTARFGKGKLLCFAVQSALKLTLVYMVVTAMYVWRPDIMANFSQFPLLSYSEEAMSLVNPLDLLKNWTTALPMVSVRLFFLLFCINIMDVTFEYTPANSLSWLGFQALFTSFGVAVYAVISYLVRRFWPGTIFLLDGIIAIVLLVIFGYLLFGKIFYTFVKKDGNAFFQDAYRIFTTQKFVSQLTVSALALLVIFCYIVVATLYGHSRMEFDSFNVIAYILNGVMCTVTLYIFSHYYAK